MGRIENRVNNETPSEVGAEIGECDRKSVREENLESLLRAYLTETPGLTPEEVEGVKERIWERLEKEIGNSEE